MASESGVRERDLCVVCVISPWQYWYYQQTTRLLGTGNPKWAERVGTFHLVRQLLREVLKIWLVNCQCYPSAYIQYVITFAMANKCIIDVNSTHIKYNVGHTEHQRWKNLLNDSTMSYRKTHWPNTLLSS